MKTNNVLTKEQQEFAAEHHNLVYDFLHKNKLPESEYYDVAIFGYLRAVLKYFNRKELQIYAFSTIAWRAMRCDVIEHYRKHGRVHRNTTTVSLSALSPKHPALVDVILIENQIIEAMEATSLWERVSKALPQEQTKVLQLSANGYTLRDIAFMWSQPLRYIENLFAEARLSAQAVCAG